MNELSKRGEVRTQAAVTAAPYDAREDVVFLWPGDVTTINVLANDRHQAGAQAELSFTTAVGDSGIEFGSGGAVTITRDDVYRFDTTRYKFVDANGQNQIAEIDVKFLSGTPGLTMTDTVFLHDQSVDSGVVTYDFREIFDQTGDYGTEILSVSAQFNGRDVFGTLSDDGKVELDFGQFDGFYYYLPRHVNFTVETRLPDGREGTGRLRVEVDPLRSTDDFTTISANGSRADILSGNARAEAFVFADRSGNGINDLDVVLNFNDHADSVEFTTPTSVEGVIEVHDGVILLTNDYEDMVYVHGTGLEFEDLTLRNITAPSGNGGTVTAGSTEEELLNIQGEILASNLLFNNILWGFI